MPANLASIRDELMPGLQAMHTRLHLAQRQEFEAMWVALGWEQVGSATIAPKPVSLPVALACGAAAAVITNPKVNRRSLFDWLFKGERR